MERDGKRNGGQSLISHLISWENGYTYSSPHTPCSESSVIMRNVTDERVTPIPGNWDRGQKGNIWISEVRILYLAYED